MIGVENEFVITIPMRFSKNYKCKKIQKLETSTQEPLTSAKDFFDKNI